MKKFLLSLLLSLSFFTNALGQNTNAIQQENLLKIGILLPDLEYEAKLSQNSTLKLETGIAPIAFGYGGNRLGWVFDYALFIEASPRYFYNFDNRLADGKNITNYSGNYIALVSRAYLYSVLSNVEESNEYILGPVWGLQRMWGKNWYFSFEIGPGILLSKEETEFVPVIGLDIGILL